MSEKTSNEMENLSLKKTNTRFLLNTFRLGRSDPDEDPDPGSEDDDVELNLGLSSNGRFGVDKNKLLRSSSIAAILPVIKDDDVLDIKRNPGGLGSGLVSGSGRGYSGLTRTSSLPVETEEQWRKRKELQSLRRLAAKRRRSEKQRSLTKGERDDYVAAMGRVGSSPGPGFGSGVERRFRKGSGGSGGETSVSQDRKNQLVGSSSSGPLVGLERQNSAKSSNQGREVGSGSMEDMPSVFTQGDGPNGRVIEGILYKYGKGEQVKIMCVCHGSFLSPVEFVKHAGGTDFDNPFKKIVVKPPSTFS
nr:ninja-family protein AFP1-like [Tanacetum cinerariifolium]